MEIWKDIKGFEGLYQVSDLGNVRNAKSKNLKALNLNGSGYYQVTLYKANATRTRKVHQMVAEAFLNHIPNMTNEIVVDHINNIHIDNRLVNLNLISNRENSSKDVKNVTSKYTGVSWHKRDNRWVSQIRIDGKVNYLGGFKSEIEASQAYQKALSSLNK